ncbi:MAG: PorT family protein [Bacteroidales bacterium]|nr:PorT family protein [Bacteroidales bacterium]
MKMGFHVGVTAEFPISDALSFNTGVLLSTKGVKMEATEDYMGVTLTSEGTYNLMYLDIPLNVKFTKDMGGAKLFGTFGPYVGLALKGTYDMSVSIGGDSESESGDLNIGSDEEDDDFKMLDFGLMVGAGVEFGPISVGASYQLGLANISPYSENGYKINNKVIGISVGYKFGGE